MYFLDKDVPIKLWKPYRMQIMKNALVISETALVCYYSPGVSTIMTLTLVLMQYSGIKTVHLEFLETPELLDFLGRQVVQTIQYVQWLQLHLEFRSDLEIPDFQLSR